MMGIMGGVVWWLWVETKKPGVELTGRALRWSWRYTCCVSMNYDAKSAEIARPLIDVDVLGNGNQTNQDPDLATPFLVILKRWM
jgi:hypothetical protein